MTVNSKRKEALIALGEHLKNYSASDVNYIELHTCIERAQAANGWFTKDSIEEAINNWGETLNEQNITRWSKPYNFSHQSQKSIALILAGNIPMVGFHDVISVWLSGHKALVKCASKDEHLLPYMTRYLEDYTTETAFTFVDKPLNHFDAVIATGSNNSARYFEHYFGEYLHIIRKNRNGVAVLSGNET
ncbi:MAG: acyl-CoA reductase, partial [Flavobacteriaceae bacterium]